MGTDCNRSEPAVRIDNCVSRWSEAAPTRYRCGPMSRRIEIELTSARPDGTWTWRAAGARAPKGVLDGSLLPAGAKIGSVLKADTDVELDGITILAVTTTKEKAEKAGLLDLIPSDKPFEASPSNSPSATAMIAATGRSSDRPPRRDGPSGDRRPRRDNDRHRAAKARSTRPRSSSRRIARPATGPVAIVPAAARGRIVARVPSAAPARTSPRRRSCRSDRSRSASNPAAPTATRCWPTFPKSSDPSPSELCRAAFRQFARQSTSRTSASRPRASPRCPPPVCCRWPSGCYRRLRVAEWLDRADAARPTSTSSISATCAALSPPEKTRWSPATNRPAQSPPS